MALASSQLQLRREYERDVEQAVQTMLDGVVGVGKAMVRASATLDFDRVETERETYEPTDAGNGVLESRRETRETYRGLADPSAIGIPGVSSNAPPKPAPATGNPRADQYERSELTAEYRVSRSVQRTLRPPGQLKRLSVAVFVDEAASVDDVEDLKTAIVAAAGLDVDRGDSVAISQVPFEPPAPAEKGSKAFAIRDFYFTVGKDLAAIVLAVIFLRFLAGMVRGRRRTGAESAPAPAPAVRPQPASDPRAPATPQSVVPEAAFDAESAAGVLRQWLSPEVASGDDGDGVKAGTRA